MKSRTIKSIFIILTTLVGMVVLVAGCVSGSQPKDTDQGKAAEVKTEATEIKTEEATVKTGEITPSVSADTFVAPAGKKIVWADEFNGPDIDLSNWNFETEETGWSHTNNNEWQRYTANDKGSPNAYITKGILAIKAIKTTGDNGGFTSARMNTQGKHEWKYGTIAARIQCPYGKGMWPAFWMLGASFSKVGWPKCGEIDIMEMIGGGFSDSKLLSTLHWLDVNKKHVSNGRNKQFRKRLADDFHVFEMDWTQDYIDIKCDGFSVIKTKLDDPDRAVFKEPFFVILNLAVGGDWPGAPDATTFFPQYLYVDWVRVYQ
jgi:beta-glucanase (GH16 family)